MLKFDLFTEQEWRFIANYEKKQIAIKNSDFFPNEVMKIL